MARISPPIRLPIAYPAGSGARADAERANARRLLRGYVLRGAAPRGSDQSTRENLVLPSQASSTQDDQAWGELQMRSATPMHALTEPMTEIPESVGSSSIAQRAIAG
jgi:hypothetical protein